MKGKKLATSELKRLFEGSHIREIVYQTHLYLIFTQRERQDSGIVGQIYLNIESTWKLFDFLPIKLPNFEDDFPKITEKEEQKKILDCLLNKTIINVELGSKHPHLIFTFENQKVFVVNGMSDFECWQAGITDSPKEHCLVVAVPGGGLAIW